jgi:hypothetical protein
MTARPARLSRRSPRLDATPSATRRRRRGPQPPDEAIAALEREWDLSAEDPPEERANRLRAALLLAWIAVILHARRGVASALPEPWAATARGAPGPAFAPAALDPLPAHRAALGNLLRAWHASAVQHFAEAIGSPGYAWTIHPERSKAGTRELHQELEGTQHSWANPPVSGTNGFRGHPGEPAECVCTAYPLPPK